MMFMSLKADDTAFVAKALAENQLDPNPETGFHARPDYWQENVRWKRVIERYKWGGVLFITDRDRRSNATIVAVGQLDLQQGRVSTQGGWVDFKPDWYKEMAHELTKLSKGDGAKLQIPPCLGFHSPEVTCDGGKNDIGMMEPACSWRDRCRALQKFSIDNDRMQEVLLKGKSPEQIIQMTTRLLANSGSLATPARAEPKAKKEPKTPAEAKQATAGARGTQATDPDQAQGVYAVVASVAREVASAAGLNVSADMSKTAAAQGDLFLVDRTANSDYISIYQAHKPKPIALASFRVRARVGVLVQLPIPKSSPLLEPIVEADVREWKDGAFLSAIREVPTDGPRLERIKHIIVAIIKQNAEQGQ
jgi:hypothetical protein